jgi:hypothetical protein
VRFDFLAMRAFEELAKGKSVISVFSFTIRDGWIRDRDEAYAVVMVRSLHFVR